MRSSLRTQFVCPMHPQIVRDAPGHCPICGMALEPRTVTSEVEANPELLDMTRRFWVAAVLALPLFVAGMADLIPSEPLGRWLATRSWQWLQFALATPVVLWAGWPFFQRAWASILNRHLNMFTLIALGTGVAYTFSLAVLLFPHWLPPSFHGHGGSIPLYFEAAAVITTLVSRRPSARRK